MTQPCRIQKLPEELIRLIAAGEVIERPASVLKELLENSLDAGATTIGIDLWGAGRTRIRITDNGEGMSREEAELALERHATSKLHAFDDLERILTFGFRGEALPSIAAVCRMTLTSRNAEMSEAWSQTLEGGRRVSAQASGAPQGTTVDVQDLFFNTPARAKFLKRDSTERSHLLKIVQELALPHPSVAFEVTMDGRKALTLPAVTDRQRRLIDLWGPAVAENLLPILFEEGPFSVEGFVNRIPDHHPTKAFQALYVNDRCVQQRMLMHGIYEAYHEWLPIGRYPVFALFVHADPAIVDVNVHPTKREVRFTNERQLFDILFRHIRDLFGARVDVPVISQRPSFQGGRPSYTSDKPQGAEIAGALDLMSRPETSFQSSFISQVAEPSTTYENPKSLAQPLRMLGQFRRLYLLAEQGEDLVIIDQHAAAERILYEKFLQRASQASTASQPLLTPFLWEVSGDQAQVVRDSLEALRSFGFDLEEFGTHAFALKAHPAEIASVKDIRRFLALLLESLEEESAHTDDHRHHEAVASAACRAAIKANDYLDPSEMQSLLVSLGDCDRAMTCPHGRPTHIRLPMGELNRRFRRT